MRAFVLTASSLWTLSAAVCVCVGSAMPAVTDLYCILTIFGGVFAIFGFIRVHWLQRLAAASKKPLDWHKLDREKAVDEPIDFGARAEMSDAMCRSFFPVYIGVCLVFPLVTIVRSIMDTYDMGDIQ
jgi:hypothetical protein